MRPAARAHDLLRDESAWLAYGKCATFDVNSATFTGTEALAEWVLRHEKLFDPPPPASNAAWVDAVELLSWAEEHVPRVLRRPSFAKFMQRLYLCGWLVRADPVCCPDVQCLRALVDHCHLSQLQPRDVIAYAVCGALLRSPTQIAAMADAVDATCPARAHCTKERHSAQCGTNPQHCVCCRSNVGRAGGRAA